MPSEQDDVALLRPLTGSEREISGIFLPFGRLGLDRIEKADFPIPSPDDFGDHIGAELLWNSARLTLRDGAGPFRSLGRVSFRPRAYQFVPLLMALRLDPIRMLIADDVGIGKTIEALLIARELYDRGDIRRLCVLCPPYLCDQWQKELWEKFQVEAVVIRSGTVSQLERQLPPGEHSIFGYYPFIVASIDYAKSERHKPNFLQHCPDFVIVDEAHGASQPSGRSASQQLRHQLLCELARSDSKHLLLLTATPHSGIEEPFLSLLGLLKEDFGRFQLDRLSEKERDSLARHFIQRRRVDVERWLGEETPFPKRQPIEETYELSPEYEDLFRRVYDFSHDLVRSGETMSGWRKRIRFWSALSLLRCVMSSPAAARAALLERAKGEAPSDTEKDVADEHYAPYVYDPTDEEAVDVQPSHIVEEGEADMEEGEQRQLRRFASLAEKLMSGRHDTKTKKCAELVADLLRQKHHPIVWCRYIATSDYLAEHLQKELQGVFSNLRVLSVTGALTEDERRDRVKELTQFTRRVLVATDCLSEGINLQKHFSAVLHYDLPWNPNRLEQREGRVDRFGQDKKQVKAILLYGRNNPVDGAVLDVLLRKAKAIHKSLGISVPIPMDSETVMESVLKALFARGYDAQQLELFDQQITTDVHQRWDEAANREKESRTRFAQRAIKPEEVQRELQETDSVLGNPKVVQGFILNACQRLNVGVTQKNGAWILSNLTSLPDLVRASVPDAEADWPVTFLSPAPENLTYLGRNHPFVSSLAQYLLEAALTRGSDAPVARCGVVRSDLVARRTVLLLLRLRFLLQEPKKNPLLAEEMLVYGLRRKATGDIEWLSDDECLSLFHDVKSGPNIARAERAEVLSEILGWWDELQKPLTPIVEERAAQLLDAHRRIRTSAHLARRGLSVTPHLPPDLLGTLVLLPTPGGKPA